MKTGVIGCLNTNNIGDYIQTLAVIKLIGKEYKILDRESLNTYNDERIEGLAGPTRPKNPEGDEVCQRAKNINDGATRMHCFHDPPIARRRSGY